MTVAPTPFTGPPWRRLPIRALLSRLATPLTEAVVRDQDRTAFRFRGRGCWRRMIALGSMLAGLAGVPVVSMVAYGLNGSYSPGMASIFGGFLQVLLILKIASPDIYPDWLSMGAFDVLIGMVLLTDPGLAGGLSCAVFILCLTLSAICRIGIGLTFRHANALIWIGVSGFVGLFLLAWFLAALFLTDDIRLDLPMAADMVLRADLTLRGLALIGFGISLKTGDE